jgi:hypothetical protein
VAVLIASGLILPRFSTTIPTPSPPPPPPSSETDIRVTEFVRTPSFLLREWVRQFGGAPYGISLSESELIPGELGVTLSRPLRRGDPIACVPTGLLVSGQTLRMANFSLAALPGLSEPEHSRDLLALFLARLLFEPQSVERDSPTAFGRWGPWVRSLPYADLPLAWPRFDTLFGGLGLTIVFPGAPYDEVKRRVLDRYPQVFGAPLRPAFSRDNFARAWALVSSRMFDDFWVKGASALLPVIDFLNHPPTIEASRTAKSTLTASRASLCLNHTGEATIPAGQEVFFNYGGERKPLQEFFFAYGFAPTDPSLDRLPVVIPAVSVGGAPPAAFASQVCHAVRDGSCLLWVHPSQPWALLPFMRASVSLISNSSAPGEIARAFCAGPPDFAECGISPDNEAKAVNHVKKYFYDLMRIAGKSKLPEVIEREMQERTNATSQERAISSLVLRSIKAAQRALETIVMEEAEPRYDSIIGVAKLY